jgi:hypothetical protein
MQRSRVAFGGGHGGHHGHGHVAPPLPGVHTELEHGYAHAIFTLRRIVIVKDQLFDECNGWCWCWLYVLSDPLRPKDIWDAKNFEHRPLGLPSPNQWDTAQTKEYDHFPFQSQHSQPASIAA